MQRRDTVKKKRRKLLIMALRTSGADKIIGSFVIFYLIAALIVWIFEPTISTYFDSLWYCFVAMATIGFGDITATVLITRIMTVILWIYGVAVIAVFTAVLSSYFMDAAKLRANESVQEFLSQLEDLPNLSKEELEALAQRVKEFHKK